MVVCAVSGCNSSHQQRRIINSIGNENVQFFRIPRDTKYKLKWEACIGNIYLKSSHAYICSKHFKDEDYAGNFNCEDSQQRTQNFKILRSDAVPTINVPVFRPPGVVPVRTLKPKSGENIVEEATHKSKTVDEELFKLQSNHPKKTRAEYQREYRQRIKAKQNVIQSDEKKRKKADYARKLRARQKEMRQQNIIMETETTQQHVKLEQEKKRKAANSKAYRERKKELTHRIDTRKSEESRTTKIFAEPKPNPKYADEEYRILQNQSLSRNKQFLQLEVSSKKPLDTCKNVMANWNSEVEFSEKWIANQMQFLDHVVMIWVNRCRGGNPSIALLDTMIKTKAREAAKILRLHINFIGKWLQSFKEKLRKQDARHSPLLDPDTQSRNIVDIINEEYGEFQINEPGLFCVGRFPCTCPDNHWNLEITFSDEWHEKQIKFLDHVMMIWINFCRGGDPKIFMLEWVIKAKAHEVAAILQTRIHFASSWFIDFKEKLKLQTARNPPIRCKPNLSIDVMDIINEEWSLFRGDDSEVLWDGINFKKSKCDKDMAEAKDGGEKIPTDSKSNDSTEMVLDCCFKDGSDDLETPDEPDQPDEPDVHFNCDIESINSYSQVFDCLMVVKSYASSVGNTEALSFIDELEDFVAKEKLGNS